MGGHEGWAQPNGFSPNGLLPNEAASVTRALDHERWSLAEERTSQLIDCIQPNPPSEERRKAVANYVQSLIMKCFSCKVLASLLLFFILLDYQHYYYHLFAIILDCSYCCYQYCFYHLLNCYWIFSNVVT